jgi:nifR3 family TIM-barrel protein
MQKYKKIKNNFWERLPKPFFALAPMADVTDCVFRELVSKYSRHKEVGGGPDVFWTEFVSADGLASAGRENLLIDLKFNPDIERPIVAQIFGAHLPQLEETARLIQELGFDGIDINMGCPDKSVEKQGAGACMIKNPATAISAIEALRRGAPNLPISIKTRVGYNKVEIDTWIKTLLELNVDALTIHARTRAEMSLVPARWEHVREVVEMRDRMGLQTKIIGNGDVKNIEEGIALAKETGCDGIMIGRGIFGTPWLFDTQRKEITLEEKLNILVEHTNRYEEILSGVKSFNIMKKHYKAYVNGFDGAKELRTILMEAPDAKTVESIVRSFLQDAR